MDQNKALAILKTGKNVFLTGSAGAGKTYVLNQYIDYLKNRKIGVAITASTGIAATHMNGQTIHSWSGMGIKDVISPIELIKLKEKKYLKDHIDNTSVLIIDEISMLHKNQLNMLNEILMAFKEDYRPFGGLQVVFSGDFFQLPPISRYDEEPKEKFAFMANSWVDANLIICYLTEQHRQSDFMFNGILNEIRTRRISSKSLQLLEESVFNKPAITPTKLYTHNIDVDRINAEHLSELSSDKFVFKSKCKGNPKLIETLKKSVLAPDELELKIGAKVMFVRNNYDNGYMNGTLGKVLDIKEDEDGVLYPLVQTYDGLKIKVEPETWSIQDEKGAAIVSLEQLPLRLAWAITVHKSQGMTLDAAEIDLSKTFENGQGYVALSRLKSFDGLQLLGANEVAFSVDDLAFKADQRFQELSEIADSKYSMEDLSKDYIPFVKSCGGLTSDEQIIQQANRRKAKKNKISTYEQTRLLLDKGLTLKDISSERGVSEGTIIGHLEKIVETHPDIDLSMYKPDIQLLEDVHAAYALLCKETANIYGDGKIKISALYKHFNECYTYNDLKLALLFLPPN